MTGDRCFYAPTDTLCLAQRFLDFLLRMAPPRHVDKLQQDVGHCQRANESNLQDDHPGTRRRGCEAEAFAVLSRGGSFRGIRGSESRGLTRDVRQGDDGGPVAEAPEMVSFEGADAAAVEALLRAFLVLAKALPEEADAALPLEWCGGADVRTAAL